MRFLKGRRTYLLGSAIAVTLAFAAVLVWAGNLEPPGPPGSTMRTLDEIHDLLLSIFERQEAEVGGEGLGAEPRLIGCMNVDDGLDTAGDPNDAADPICGNLKVYEFPWTRVVAGAQSMSRNIRGSTSVELFKPLVVTKNVDRGSVLRFKNLVEGATLTEVTIDWYRVDGKALPERYATISLDNAFVIDQRQRLIPTAGGDFLHVEDVQFGYGQITWIYQANGATHTTVL